MLVLLRQLLADPQRQHRETARSGAFHGSRRHRDGVIVMTDQTEGWAMGNEWEPPKQDDAAQSGRQPGAGQPHEVTPDGQVSWQPPDVWHRAVTGAEPGPAPLHPASLHPTHVYGTPVFPVGGPVGPGGHGGAWHVAPTPRRRTGRLVAASVAAALVIGGLGVGIGVHEAGSSPTAAASSATSGTSTSGGSSTSGGTATGGGTTQTTPNGSGRSGFDWGTSGGLSGSGGSTTSTSSTTTLATDAQQMGIVDIDTVLGLQDAEAAGTGMVLTSDGEILTNNHVISGATSITVTVVSTGKTYKTYKASVVGYDASKDVAVLQLADASGLQTIKTDTGTLSVGDAVTGVGNAGGVGGTPSAAAGTVVALDQSITASDESGSGSEQLTGLIQTDAGIAAGDSGGPLFETDDEVVGMDTAASTGGATQAYAIPIQQALTVARSIESGKATATVHIGGTTAFLGVGVQSANVSGAGIVSVQSGSPAESAGIVAGDVITAVGGTAVTDAAGLSTALQTYDSGDKVTITFTDQSGASHTAGVTLASGPPA
jgi:S1-C subfamily serine protease